MNRLTNVNLILKRLKSTKITKKQVDFVLVNTPDPTVFKTNETTIPKNETNTNNDDNNAAAHKTKRKLEFNLSSYLQYHRDVKSVIKAVAPTYQPLDPDDEKIWERDTDLVISCVKRNKFGYNVKKIEPNEPEKAPKKVAKKAKKQTESDTTNITKLLTKDQTKTKKQTKTSSDISQPTTNTSTSDSQKSLENKSDENSTSSVSGDESTVDSDVRRNLLHRIQIEEMKKQSEAISFHAKVLSKHKLDDEFLDSHILSYPIIANEDVDKLGYVYDKSDIELLPKRLIDAKTQEGFDEKRLKRSEIPSVTRILDLTKEPERQMKLFLWQVEQICEKGEEGFKQYKGELLQRGKIFHSAIESILRGKKTYEEIEMPAEHKVRWQSMEQLIKSDISKPLMIERAVTHPNLWYTGYLDCVANYKDELCIIDWKHKGDKMVNSEYLYDDPLQLVAYLGAYLHDPNLVELRKEKRINTAILVYTYENGREPSIFPFNFQHQLTFWTQWLERVKKFWITVDDFAMKNNKHNIKI